jgi:hypothetical protein
MGLDLAYNQYAGYSQIPYKIMEYLMTTNENLWRLCAYPESDALSPSRLNLTIAQKRALIYGGQTDSTPYRVFTVKYTDDAVERVQTQIRIYMNRVYPKDYVVGMIDFCIDVFCHNKIAVLTYPGYKPNRYDVMFEEVMKTLNGKDVDTLGRLFFNAEANGRNSAELVSFDSKHWFQGYQIRMSTMV